MGTFRGSTGRSTSILAFLARLTRVTPGNHAVRLEREAQEDRSRREEGAAVIPSRREVIPVILDFMSDGQRRASEDIQEMIAVHFGLTDEERCRKRGKGPHPEYVNETAWALVDLQKDALIKKLAPDVFAYRITDSGRHAATNRTFGIPIPPRRDR
jgi:hypothetical protein